MRGPTACVSSIAPQPPKLSVPLAIQRRASHGLTVPKFNRTSWVDYYIEDVADLPSPLVAKQRQAHRGRTLRTPRLSPQFSRREQSYFSTHSTFGISLMGTPRGSKLWMRACRATSNSCVGLNHAVYTVHLAACYRKSGLVRAALPAFPIGSSPARPPVHRSWSMARGCGAYRREILGCWRWQFRYCQMTRHERSNKFKSTGDYFLNISASKS